MLWEIFLISRTSVRIREPVDEQSSQYPQANRDGCTEHDFLPIKSRRNLLLLAEALKVVVLERVNVRKRLRPEIQYVGRGSPLYTKPASDNGFWEGDCRRAGKRFREVLRRVDVCSQRGETVAQSSQPRLVFVVERVEHVVPHKKIGVSHL